MKTLNTLIRYRKRQLDELRRQVGVLEEKKQALLRKSEGLRQELEKEVVLAAEQPEMGAFFGNFAERIRTRRAEIAGQVLALEKQQAALAEKIREQFAELKRFEIVRDNRAGEERATLNRAEASALDELAVERFARTKEEQ